MEPDALRRCPTDKYLTAACLLSGLMALAVVLLAWSAGPTKLAHYSWLAAGALFGMSLGLLLVRAGLLELPATDRLSVAEIGIVAAGGIVLALITYWCGMRQFVAFDQSELIDVGWRLVGGQRPYVDFPCTLPVGFYLGVELAFRLFGVYWRSIILFHSICTLLSFLWLYLILRATLQNRLLSFWGALACEMMSMVLVSFWWYNPVTSISAVIYAASVVAVIREPRRWWSWVSLCLGLFLIALMKPNVAGPVILGGSLSLLAFRPTRLPALLASALALVFWLLAIHIHGSTLGQVIGSYLSVASRGVLAVDFMLGVQPVEKMVEFFLLFALCVPWFVKFPPRLSGPDWPIILFLPFCALAGLYGFVTNNEIKIIDFPLLLFAAIYFAASGGPLRGRLILSHRWTGYLTCLCAVLACLGLSEALSRHRAKANYDFFEFTEVSEPYPVPFFQGLHTGPIFHSVVDHIAAMCATQDMTHAFFANRLQWAYAAFHLQSPKNQPIWWHPGVSFSAADQSLYMKDWLSRGFNPVLVMDTAFISDEFVDSIALRYGLRSEWSYGNKNPLHVLVLRDQAGSPLPPWRPLE